MKFYGNPNELVNTRKKVNGMFKTIPLFRFNSDGEFTTTDNGLINRLKNHFAYENPKRKKE